MIDDFRHLSLLYQILADMSFPIVFGVVAFGNTKLRASTWGEQPEDDQRSGKAAGYIIGLAYVAMFSLTIYVHVTH
jgi:hypothetical protein